MKSLFQRIYGSINLIIKEKLHCACSEGDLELIKIYLSETIENETKTLKFKIDRANQTASLFSINDNIEHIVIPRTVRCETADYLITSISGTSGRIKTIKFSGNSEVKMIYRDLFPCSSSIEEICFPSSLKELKEGWCCGTNKLTN